MMAPCPKRLLMLATALSRAVLPGCLSFLATSHFLN